MVRLLNVLLLSSVKFVFGAPISMLIGLSYFESVWVTSVGGIGGFLFFFFLSGWVFGVFKLISQKLKSGKLKFSQKKAKGSSIAFRRRLIRMKQRYGFWGLVILTPTVLSIPLGAILARKYFYHHKGLVGAMTLSILSWSMLLASLVYWCPSLI